MAGLVPAIHVFLRAWPKNADARRINAFMPVFDGPWPGMTQKLGRASVDYTGRTSVTSGTKWRSRFWMPCFRVAVEDGQPEQAPCMCR